MALPPQHKKRLYQGIILYLVLVAVVAGWVWSQADKSRAEWEKKIPRVSAALDNPSIPDAASETAENGTESADDAENENAAEETTAGAAGSQATISGSGSGSAPASQGSGKIAIIITNIGISKSATEMAFDSLPEEVAFALSPYAKNIKDLAAQAKSDGHQTLLLLPMEPVAYPKDDPGPNALLTRRSEEENKKMLNWALHQATDFTGAMNFMGTRFLQDEKNTLPVFTTLKQKKMVFVEDTSDAIAAAGNIARTAELPYVATDVTLDKNAAETAVRQQLIALEKIAAEKGYAVGLAHPYPSTINTIKLWSESLDSRGIRLVPLSEIFGTAAHHAEKEQPKQPDTP